MPSRPFRLTAAADFFVAIGSSSAIGRITGARLVAGAGVDATAQITDARGTVLVDLSAPAKFSDECDQEIQFEGKVTLASLVGAGASVIVWVA